MNITGNIEAQRDFILKDPEGAGKTRAEDIAKAAILAIKKGMNSDEWREFMSYYAKSGDELNRLCGLDQDFNDTHWGRMTPTYIAANALCTVRTTRKDEKIGHTLLNMPDDMIQNLDK